MKQVVRQLQIVGSRICHDLATPIGALGLGLELLRDQDLSPDHLKTLSLIDESLSAAKNRLTLFRFLLGQDQGEDGPLMINILPCLQTHWQSSRLTLQTEGLDALRGTAARFTLGTILTASEGLPRGGDLLVCLHDKTLEIKLQGTHVDFPQSSFEILAGKEQPASGRALFPWYTAILAQVLSCRFELCHDNVGLTLTCKDLENVSL